MQANLKGTRGKFRKDFKNWIESVKEVRELTASQQLTQQNIDRMVWDGCTLTGAIPATQMRSKGMAQVWLTSNESQSGQVNSIHDLGDQLKEEMDSWTNN